MSSVSYAAAKRRRELSMPFGFEYPYGVIMRHAAVPRIQISRTGDTVTGVFRVFLPRIDEDFQ